MTEPSTLRQLHASLAAHAPDQMVTILQEVGYAAGEGLYRAFAAEHNPTDLDADRLGEVLSDFLAGAGWGTLTMSPVGTGALALDSTDWAEAEPGSAQSPMCFFSAGMLADFLGRLSDQTVSVMEVECRCRGDAGSIGEGLQRDDAGAVLCGGSRRLAAHYADTLEEE